MRSASTRYGRGSLSYTLTAVTFWSVYTLSWVDVYAGQQHESPHHSVGPESTQLNWTQRNWQLSWVQLSSNSDHIASRRAMWSLLEVNSTEIVQFLPRDAYA